MRGFVMKLTIFLAIVASIVIASLTWFAKPELWEKPMGVILCVLLSLACGVIGMLLYNAFFGPPGIERK